MKKSTTEQTNEYIKEHPYIKSCLKKGLINYSALARLISKDLKIEKKTSKEAILIAARRFYEKIKKELVDEKKIKNLLKKSELEIKNKICVLILHKNPNSNKLEKIQKEIKEKSGLFYLLEGSDNYTIITQNKFNFENELQHEPIKSSQDLVLINIKSPKEIEKIPGVIAFLTSLLAENNINIIEFLSCWSDTLFVISQKDLNKAISILNF